MAKDQVDFTNDFEEYIRQGEPDKKEILIMGDEL